MQITMTGLPQCSITVMIDNYANLTQIAPVKLCTVFPCIMVSERKCCDGFDSGSFQCHRCDSYFTYCLRKVDTLTAGCPEDGHIMSSDGNPNYVSIDFSQSTVLGLVNPLIFQGPSIWGYVMTKSLRMIMSPELVQHWHYTCTCSSIVAFIVQIGSLVI